MQATQEFLEKRLSAIKSQRSTGELEDLALIIGMSTDGLIVDQPLIHP